MGRDTSPNSPNHNTIASAVRRQTGGILKSLISRGLLTSTLVEVKAESQNNSNSVSVVTGAAVDASGVPLDNCADAINRGTRCCGESGGGGAAVVQAWRALTRMLPLVWGSEGEATGARNEGIRELPLGQLRFHTLYGRTGILAAAAPRANHGNMACNMGRSGVGSNSPASINVTTRRWLSQRDGTPPKVVSYLGVRVRAAPSLRLWRYD